jgi:hypothetical protein
MGRSSSPAAELAGNGRRPAADPIPRGRADRGAVAIARIDLRAECGRKIPIARSRAGGEVAVRGEERSVRE